MDGKALISVDRLREEEIRILDNQESPTPFFHQVLLAKTCSLEDTLSYMACYPSCCLGRDSQGNYALHVALMNRPHIHLVEALVQAYPWALMMENNDGNLPLHSAVLCGASCVMIALLVNAYPEALAHRNHSHCLPLHLLMMQGQAAEVGVANIIVQSYPQACSLANSFGCLPLHGAAFFGVKLEVFLLLMEVNPSACRLLDKQGWLPLHVAVGSKMPSLLIMASLLLYHSRGLMVRDNLGIYPADLLDKRRAHWRFSVLLMLGSVFNWMMMTATQILHVPSALAARMLLALDLDLSHI
jgi:hypothetical protein